MLYRKHRTSAPLWLILSGAVVVGLLGFLGGRLSAPPPTLQALLAPDALHLRQASGALDIAELEYARAVQGSAASQQASLDAVTRVRHEVQQASMLRQLTPQPAAQLDQQLQTLERDVRQHLAQAEFAQAVQQVHALLRQLGAVVTP